MKGDRKQFLAVILMITSLIFLFGFLSLFLYNSYNEEKENLQKEVGYLFVNSIRKIEGGIINKLVFEEDSTNIRKMRFPRLKRDSLKIKSIISIADHNMSTNEGKFEIEVRRHETSNNLNQLEGSVAMFIALSHDSTQVSDSCISLQMNTEFLEELKNNFHKNMEAAQIPISYTIVKERENAVHATTNLVSGSYTDISSGDRYAVNIEKYGLLVFKKIFPEFIFSILLFICIVLAFYMIYKTLASEKMLLNLKNEFIQNITHELKTPIATVSVALEALQDFNVQENKIRRNEYLDISKNELKRLSLLVDKVLNISQLENVIPPIQLAKLDVKEIIVEILNTLKLQFEKMNVEVHFESNGEEFIIKGDRQRLDVLLYNLLDNAIKYNSNTQPKIDIQLVQLGNQIKIILSDNGIGIPIEHQKNVFDKFYRVPQGNLHDVKGHGLGLSFVAQVVKEMEGEIQLESDQTVGSTFIIQIPSWTI